MSGILRITRHGFPAASNHLCHFFCCSTCSHTLYLLLQYEAQSEPADIFLYILYISWPMSSSRTHLQLYNNTCFLFSLPLRENNFKHKEENHHGNSTCDNCHKHVIDCRCHICRCNWHPQIIKSITNQ